MSFFLQPRNCGAILLITHICQMWRNFRFIHIFHMAIFKNTPHVEKYLISPHHAKKSEISPPDKFFSPRLAGDTSSTIKFPHKPIFSISFYFHFPLDIQLQPQNNIQQLIINQTPHCTVNMELHLRYVGNISGLPLNISF